ncbi:hypothetical protein RD792_017691 [Penstemon davidsonii]|uniref:Cytochrome P450 n=1 Tax=Penstemon davidsonii TaxID=160366 RepID=A0ABR0DX04_9LAMI|nr:hypothetical protein RD792_017691 [Penstemon davidsonii]
MNQLAIAALSISVIVVSIFWYIRKPTSKAPPLPPGPLGLPIVGYLPFLNQNLLVQFSGLAQKYGPIVKLRVGNKLWVVIASPSLAKEVVRDHDLVFSNRDVPIAAQVVSFGENDMAWSPNNSGWRKMRKVFVHDVLSNINLDGSYNLRKDIVRKTIIDVYSTKIEKPIEMGELIGRCILNIILNLLWGGTIEGDEGERVITEFKALLPKLVGLLGKPNISDFFPILSGLDIQGVKKDMEIILQSYDRILDVAIAIGKKKLSENVIDQGRKDFLQILLELKENDEDTNRSITSKQLKGMLMDIVVAGTDTQSTTVEWAMAELMNNPEIMVKVQQELSSVIGINNMVEESHAPKLQYLRAVIKETLRLHPAVPLLLTRFPTKDSTIGGYSIPKNTTVFINACSIQRDPSIWHNPLKFKPERFLDTEEKMDFSGNTFSYIPFGSGRRLCPGTPLAERMMVHLLASLLHSFEWKLPKGETLDMSEKFGIGLKKNTPLFVIPSLRLSNLDLYT